MPSFSRTNAISALAGVTMLAWPIAGTAADPVAAIPETPKETVEQRITSLHESLHITANEESKWNGVTRSMRDNAAALEKLMAEKNARDPAELTAVEDLKNYEKFAQAHATGLRRLTASFTTLYQAMPDAQKKVADAVFENFGHQPGGSHG